MASHPPADPAPYQALVRRAGAYSVEVLDQRRLPHETVRLTLASTDEATVAIRDMIVRGAPLIGAVGAYGLALAVQRDPSDAHLQCSHAALDAARPTAVNLRWALDRVRHAVAPLAPERRAARAWEEADRIVAEDLAQNHGIGVHGLTLLRALARGRAGTLNVMTHCNAGALATCGWGTATAAVFLAHEAGIPLHLWVSETRPRLQGANLTAWECAQRGIPHTLVSDSASGLLMRRGDVDIVVVGADRVAANGDVCNKIGTYDKALAAADNGVPFYVAMPSPTLDPALDSGDSIPIEQRSADEVLVVHGRGHDGGITSVRIAPDGTHALNYAFDVTPARLVTGILTERGVVAANRRAIEGSFPERFGR